MSGRQLLPFILAAIGGLGGFVDTVVYSDMVAALNALRAPNDQIPFAITDWDALKSPLDGGRLTYWHVLRQFRREFPHSRLNAWNVASLAWMLIFLSQLV